MGELFDLQKSIPHSGMHRALVYQSLNCEVETLCQSVHTYLLFLLLLLFSVFAHFHFVVCRLLRFIICHVYHFSPVPWVTSGPQDVAGSLHQGLALDCEVKGYPIPGVHWEFKADNGDVRVLPSKLLHYHYIWRIVYWYEEVGKGVSKEVSYGMGEWVSQWGVND